VGVELCTAVLRTWEVGGQGGLVFAPVHGIMEKFAGIGGVNI